MEVHQLRKAFGRVIKRKALFQAALDTGFQLGFFRCHCDDSLCHKIIQSACDMTPQMIMRKPCCQMDLLKGIRIRNIFLLNEIQADRENSHQCAVAVGIFARFAAGCEVVAVAILIDGVAAGIPLWGDFVRTTLHNII